MPQLTAKEIAELKQLKEDLVSIRAKIDKALLLLDKLAAPMPKQAAPKRKETMKERKERVKKMFNGLSEKLIPPDK